MLDAEQNEIEQNQAEVVNRGRAPNAAILQQGQAIPIEEWCRTHVASAMQPLAELLDDSYNTDIYSSGNGCDAITHR